MLCARLGEFRVQTDPVEPKLYCQATRTDLLERTPPCSECLLDPGHQGSSGENALPAGAPLQAPLSWLIAVQIKGRGRSVPSFRRDKEQGRDAACRHKLFEPAHELLVHMASSPVLRSIGCHLVGELIHHATIRLQDVNKQVGALLIK